MVAVVVVVVVVVVAVVDIVLVVVVVSSMHLVTGIPPQPLTAIHHTAAAPSTSVGALRPFDANLDNAQVIGV